MHALERAKTEIAAAVSKFLPPGLEASPGHVVAPADPALADLSYPCYRAARETQAAPAKVAAALASRLSEDGGLPGVVSRVTAVGPYLNFSLDADRFGAAVVADVAGAGGAYGGRPSNARRVLLEYGSVNTHKDVHVGHLLNLCLGLSLGRLMRFRGDHVTEVNYLGDMGAHVAKWLWYAEKTPSAARMTPGEAYALADAALSEGGAAAKLEADGALRRLEAGEKSITDLWDRTSRSCRTGFLADCLSLGITFSRTYLESEMAGAGRALVERLRREGVVTGGDGGALVVDLADSGLGTFLALKSDGGTLYGTKELALAECKEAEYPGMDEHVHVVDSRQSLYFRQVFAVLGKTGGERPVRTHAAHDFVTLKGGAMASRKGNVVTYREFSDRMKEKAMAEVASRHPEWPARDREAAAWTVAEGAIKFGMLKQEADRPLTFDMEEALSFDGFTGPYAQYAYARLSSLLSKAQKPSGVTAGLHGREELILLRQVAALPGAAAQAADTLSPYLVARYAYDLAKEVNRFYAQVPVLEAKAEDRTRLLSVVSAARTALGNSLWLLGIRTTEQM